ncbi:enoyl-CoA hydratase [Oceanicoccus sp. KOV_DT_Chl]|uniref:enoyl-CoA hydratase n=1 Tax=Oceanicoccus sp. KOV_DT_Chl TaxID=1904639 RepID=UPI000C7A781D|nr:enoyl-CoA hydratase [Oceanicoccus sp. KOV_DT_Chl]
MGDSLVQVEIDQQVAIITLNRPETLNALNAAMRDQLVGALLKLKTNREVRVVILTGAGRAFCAGLDMTELKNAGDEVAQYGFIGRELLDVLSDMDCPVIAAVNGFAVTGGLELALRCDVVLASTDAIFADTHARVGIVPAWGITQRLPRIIGPLRAKEMSLSGRKIDAKQAYEWGLINRMVPAAELMEEAKALAIDMAACDSGAQRAIKTLIDVGWQSSIEEGLLMEQTASVQVFRSYIDSQK